MKIVNINDTQDIYDENDNIISTLRVLIDEIEIDKDLKEDLLRIIWEKEEKNEELERELEAEANKEYTYMNRSYEKSQI